MYDFVVWLNAEIKKQGWSLEQTAQRVGVSHTAMTDIVNGRTRPSAEFCRRIAMVLHASPEEVFRRAGLLPPESKGKLVLREAIHLFGQFIPEQ
jgi:transcriptional regulator with XRE-family HTH domain